MPNFKVKFQVDRSVSKAALDAEIAHYKQTAKEADIAAKAKAKADQAQAQEQKRIARDLAEAQKKAAKEVAEAQKRAAADATSAQKSLNDQIHVGVGAAKSFVNVLSNVTGITLGLGAIAQGVQVVTQAFEDSKRHIAEAGEFVRGYRDALKELAFLKGQPGGTSEVVAADLDYRRKTLQSQADARKVQEEFRNNAGISIDTDATRAKITEAEATKAMIYAGQQQAFQGGDAGAYGTLAGIIPSVEKTDRVTADQIKTRMYQLTKIGEKGNASPAVFADQMGQSAYLTQGGAFSDLGQMGAYGSALGLASTPAQIGERLKLLTKGTVGSINDMTKSPNAQMAPGQYLKGLGLTDQNNTHEMAQAIMADLEKTQAEGAAQGKTVNPLTYFEQRGYDRSEIRDTFQQLYARRGDLNRTLLPMADTNYSVAEAEKGFGEFKGTIGGLQQRSAVNADAARFNVGGGAPEYMKLIQDQAHSAMGKDAWGTADDYRNSSWFNPFTSPDVLDKKAREILRDEGLKKGLDWAVQEKYSKEAGGYYTVDPLADLLDNKTGSSERQQAFFKRAQEVGLAKGDPGGDNSKVMMDMSDNNKRSADALIGAEKALRGIEAKLAPAPVTVVPPGGRNAGLVR